MTMGIYKIENIQNNKCYIGQSINIENRWKKHLLANDDFTIHKALRKYGKENFIFSILEECNQDELNEKEIYWIEYYDSLIPNGYNMVPGGFNGSGYLQKKPVEQYTLDGIYLRQFESAATASRETGVEYTAICACCREKIRSTGGYQWKYVDTNKKITPIIRRSDFQVLQINILTGDIVNCFDSLAEAERATSISKVTICNVCNGKGKTAGGFYWKYLNNDENIKNKKKTSNSWEKPVNCYDKQGKFLKQYKSITEAYNDTGINKGNIGEVCKGRRKTAGGFRWEYAFIDFE